MHVRILASVALFLSLALAAACGSDEGGGKDTGSTCDSSLTYENFGKAFMTANCLACHNASRHEEGYDFSTQANIQDAILEIDHAAAAGPDATNTSMPDGTSLSVDVRKQLGAWLACGAL